MEKLTFDITVKNNVGVPTKFVGTKDEFKKAFEKYFKSDTYGKIIGYTSHTQAEIEKLNGIENSDAIDDNIKAFNHWLTVGRFTEVIDKKKINKRYHRYL